jgi:hypothetical protein
MSSDDWRERVRRFQGNDLLLTLVVIVMVSALGLYEGIVYIQGKPTAGHSVSEGPVGRILLGALVALTYFKGRQTHKDVVQDVGATTELRENVERNVAPAIRDATARLDSDTTMIVKALETQHNAAIQKIIEDRRVERHDLMGQLQAAQLLRQESEHECKRLAEKIGLLEGLMAVKTRGEEHAADRAADRAEDARNA